MATTTRGPQTRTRRAVIGLAVLALFLLIAVLVFQLSSVRRSAADRAFRHIEELYGVRITADPVEFSLPGMRFDLRNVRLESTGDTPADTPFFEAGRLYVNLATFSLLGNTIVIEEFLVEDAQVAIVIDEVGQDNLPGLPGGDTGTEAAGPGIRIRQLQADGTGFRFTDESRDLEVIVPEWVVGIESVEDADEHNVVAGLGEGAILRRGDLELDIHNADLEMVSGPGALEVESFRLASTAVELDAAGSVGSFDSPAPDLTIDAAVDLGELARMAEFDLPVSGELLLTSRIAGDFTNLNVTGEGQGEGLAVGDFVDLSATSRFAWNRADGNLGLEALTVESPDGRLDVSGRVALDEAARTDLEIQVESLDVERLAALAGLPVQVASRASGMIGVSWPGFSWEELDAEGGFELVRSADPVTPSRLPLAASVSFAGGVEGMNVAIDSASVSNLSLSGQIELDAYERIDARIAAQSTDAAILFADIDRLLAEGPQPAETPKPVYPSGPIQLTAHVSGPLDLPVIEYEVRARETTLPVLPDSAPAFQVQARGSFQERVLTADPIVLEWNGETITAWAEMDFRGNETVLSAMASGAGFQLENVLATLSTNDAPAPGAGVVSGTIDLEARASGPLDSLTGEFLVSGSDVAVYGQSFETLDAAVDLTPDAVELIAFSLSGGGADAGGQILASGSHVLDTGAIDFALNGTGIDLSGFTFPGADGFEGTVTFSAVAEGTADDPLVMLDAMATGASYEGAAIGDVAVDGRLEGEMLTIRARAASLNLDADLGLGLAPGYPATLQAATTGLDLSRIEPLVPPDEITGTVAASIQAAGDLEDWTGATATVEIDALDIQVEGQSLRTQGQAVFSYEGRRVTAEPFTLVAGDQQLEISGELPVETGAVDGVVRVQGALDLGPLAAILAPDGPPDVEGALGVDVELTGSLEEVGVNGLMELRGGAFPVPGSADRIGPVDADVRIDESVVFVDDVTATWSGASILVEGALPLHQVSEMFRESEDESVARLNATATGLELASIPGAGSIEGTADLVVELESEGLSLDELEGTVRLDRLDLESTPIGISPDDPIVVVFSDGIGTLEPFVLNAAGTEIRGSGEFGLTGDRPIRFELQGQGDTAALTAASTALGASGDFFVDVSVEGALDRPAASGSIRFENVGFDVTEPPVEGRNLNATIRFVPGMVTLQSLSGILNDGTISASGTLGYEGTDVTGVGFDISGRNIYFEAIEGFETLSNAYIQVRSSGDVIEVSGGVQVLDGSYTNDLALEDLLRDALGTGSDDLFVDEPNPLLSRVRYNVNIRSVNPILVSNDAAELEADVNVRFTGTYDDPGLVGRVFIAEGGTIRLQETEFVMQSGFIEFANPTRIEPGFSLSAATTKAEYEITMDVSGGGAADIETTFVSIPPLPEPEIIALLVTGRTLEGVRGAELNIAREQALSYLTGQLGGTISAGAEEALGLSRVTIEPNLIANESDPGARLTVGQDITRNLGLIYSMNLTDSNDQIWIAEYAVQRRFLARSVKQEDNSYRFEFNHRMTFGDPVIDEISQALTARTIGTVEIEPQTIGSIDIAGEFGLRPGDSYNPFSVRNARRELTELLRERNYIEADVRVERTMEGERMNLRVTVNPGPQVQFVYEGAAVGGRTQEDVRQAWAGSTFDSVRSAMALRALRSRFIRDRYFEIESEFMVEEDDGQQKTVRFEVRPGMYYEEVQFEFPGASGISAASLRDLVDEPETWPDLILGPGDVQELVEQHYRSRAYLDVDVEEPEARFDAAARTAVFSIAVSEGPEYRLGPEIVFSGNVLVPETELTIGLPEAGVVFEPTLLDTATDVLYQHYWERGFSNVTIDGSVVGHPEAGIVGLAFEIDENEREVVEEIRITGNNRTSENLIRNQIPLTLGQPLDIGILGTTRRNLYNTGAFTLVDVQALDVDEQSEAPAGPDLATGGGERPVRLEVDVQEVPPFSLRYGAFYDTERGPGGTIDLRNQNSLGSARTLGFRLRYDGRLREARTFFSQPALLRLPFQSNAGIFLRDERQTGLVTREIGLDLQQEIRLTDSFLVTYGYTFLHSRNFNRDEDTGVIDHDPFETNNVAPLSLSVTRDTRDDLLDASRGTFTTHSIEYAPEMLGSSNGLIRYFGQYFRYRPLSEPMEIPYSGGERKSRFVYAGGVRLGLAAGLRGSAVPVGERFFAGGGTTIRGFEQDMVGPMGLRDGEIRPLGGGAVLTINNEIRFPIVNIFDGVGFVDFGNVYDTVGDFDPFHLRSSAGVGLRVRTPFFLLRADYGLKLDRKPGESRGTFFFSIGQAF